MMQQGDEGIAKQYQRNGKQQRVPQIAPYRFMQNICNNSARNYHMIQFAFVYTDEVIADCKRVVKAEVNK